MVKEILINSDIINERAMEWDVKDNQELSTELVQNLTQTLMAHPERMYLCSNEIGYKERALVLKFSDENKVFMNPVFQKREGLKLVRELDPLTGKQFIIPRYTDTIVCYQNCMGKIEAYKLNEAASVVLSQAMDTLEGIHSSDYGLEVDEEFDRATPEEQAEILSLYIKSLDKFREKLDEDLSNNDETNQEWDAFKFMKAKNNGEIETAEEDGPKLNRKQRRFLDRIAKKFKRKNN